MLNCKDKYKTRLGKSFSLVLYFCLIAIFASSQEHKTSIDRFAQKLKTSVYKTYAYQFQQQITKKPFTGDDTIKNTLDVVLIVKNGKTWFKYADNKHIVAVSADSTRQIFFKRDSVIYTGQEKSSWENAFLPLFPGYIYEGKNVFLDKLDTLTDRYVLTYHFYTDSTTLFSFAKAITTFRKKDLMPVCHETFIAFQGMWQYEKMELSQIEKIKPDEKLAILGRNLPVKKIVNCAEGRILADFSMYENKRLGMDKIKSLNAENMDFSKTKPKLILLDCFYVSCFPCRKAVPVLNNIYEKYKNKGVCIAGIDNIDHDSSRVLKFIKDLKVEYPVSIKAKEINLGFPVTSYPTILIFNDEGIFIKGLVGYHEALEQELDGIIREQLKK